MRNLIWIKKMHPPAGGKRACCGAILFRAPLGFGRGFRYKSHDARGFRNSRDRRTAGGWAHGVGAVFNQADAEFGAHGSQCVHIANMPAHVGQQQRGGAAGSGFAAQVVQVDEQVFGHVHQHGHCAGRDPVIRALADGAHLVGRRARAAIGADRGAEVGRGQFARGGKDMIGNRRPGRADRRDRRGPAGVRLRGRGGGDGVVRLSPPDAARDRRTAWHFAAGCGGAAEIGGICGAGYGAMAVFPEVYGKHRTAP